MLSGLSPFGFTDRPQIYGRLLLGRILDLNRTVSVCVIEEFRPWLLSFLIDQLHELDRRTVFIDMLNRLFEVFQKKVVTPLRRGLF
jgi:hypothetical protein